MIEMISLVAIEQRPARKLARSELHTTIDRPTGYTQDEQELTGNY